MRWNKPNGRYKGVGTRASGAPAADVPEVLVTRTAPELTARRGGLW